MVARAAGPLAPAARPPLQAPASAPVQLKTDERLGHDFGRVSVRASAPAARAGGRPLPVEVRGKMERSFGTDFSDVRVHEDSSARAIGAAAFTRGADIHFAPGKFSPHAGAGQRLLGHELTHVVQQRAGRVRGTPVGGMSLNTSPALEAEADRQGAKAARGEPATVHASGAAAPQASAGVVQAQPGLNDLPDELLLKIAHHAVGDSAPETSNVDAGTASDARAHLALAGVNQRLRRVAGGGQPSIDTSAARVEAEHRTGQARAQGRLAGLDVALANHPLNDPLRARIGPNFNPGNAFLRSGGGTRKKGRRKGKARIAHIEDPPG